MIRVVCLTHKEDVDGIASAALIKAVFKKGSVVLVDYANVIHKLEKMTTPLSAHLLADDGKANRVFICDLGLSKKNEQKFVDIMAKIISAGSNVTYIDHHDLSKETALELKKIGVRLIHSLEECTSVQVYSKFKKRLKSHAAFFAAAGALTDYMENKPIASSIVSRFDRQFLMLESTVLSYMILANQNNEKFLMKIVDTLSKMKYPHEIEGGFLIAEKYALRISEAVRSIESSVIKIDDLAYAESNLDLSASVVVNFVLGISGKPVAMVYKLKEEINSYVISIRGSKACNLPLGKLVNGITSELGGSGGGHDKAAGAVVPKDKLTQFIYLMNKRIKDP